MIDFIYLYKNIVVKCESRNITFLEKETMTMGIWRASKVAEMSAREKAHMEKVRGFAAEGMVLLENDGTLPLGDGVKKLGEDEIKVRHKLRK